MVVAAPAAMASIWWPRQMPKIGMSAPEVVAVGETGLDHYRTREAEGREAQEVSFRAHIGWAKTYGRTLMIHDRDAHDDILRVLDPKTVEAALKG